MKKLTYFVVESDEHEYDVEAGRAELERVLKYDDGFPEVVVVTALSPELPQKVRGEDGVRVALPVIPQGEERSPTFKAPVEGPVLALVQDGALDEQASPGEQVEVLLPATPFYIEAINVNSSTLTRFKCLI